MKKVGFIGMYDKTDLMLNIAKILTTMKKKVIVVDSTLTQKAKYVVPVINPTVTYITDFEDIDVAIGFKNEKEIKDYLGLPENEKLPYDVMLIDADNAESIEIFELGSATKNYFVTAFDLYSLKRGLEILSCLTEVLNLTKVIFSRTASREDDDYLNYLALGYKIVWSEEIVYFPYEVGDFVVIAENQKVSKIKFRKLSTQYKEALIYIAEQILEQDEYAKMKKTFKQLERGV